MPVLYSSLIGLVGCIAARESTLSNFRQSSTFGKHSVPEQQYKWGRKSEWAQALALPKKHCHDYENANLSKNKQTS
jgi:hypothetical protein